MNTLPPYLTSPHTSGMAGLSVVRLQLAGWPLSSQLAAEDFVQKRASPELPSIVCIQGGMIYTTYTS